MIAFNIDRPSLLSGLYRLIDLDVLSLAAPESNTDVLQVNTLPDRQIMTQSRPLLATWGSLPWLPDIRKRTRRWLAAEADAKCFFACAKDWQSTLSMLRMLAARVACATHNLHLKYLIIINKIRYAWSGMHLAEDQPIGCFRSLILLGGT